MQTFEIVFRYDTGNSGGWQSWCRAEGLTRTSRTLSAGRSGMRRALAEAHECPEAEVALDERFELPPGLGELLDRVRVTRRQAEEQRRRSLEATREAVACLAEEAPRMGMRDIAALVGVSYQRVQQLLSER